MNLNKAFILGNLTRDPEVKALPSGQSVANFGMATNRFYTDRSGEKKQQAEFHNVVAFGRLADISSRYLIKGSLALIEGRLQTRSWQDSAGNRRSRTEIIAQNIQLAPRSFGKTIPPTPEGTSPGTEEIPIIEENYTPPPPPSREKKPEQKVETKDEEKPTSSKERGTDEQEISVKDIPC